MIEVALNIAEKAFVGKKDKGGKPYVEHLKRVAENAKSYYGPVGYLNELTVVGLLHDLLEDCPEWTPAHLTAVFRDVSIVHSIKLLTKKPGQSYEDYIHNIRNDGFARAVKLADLYDNMNVSRLNELTDKDFERLKKYHKAYRFLLGDSK